MSSRLVRPVVVCFVISLGFVRPPALEAQTPIIVGQPPQTPPATHRIAELPPNIVVTPVLLPTVTAMLATSNTFRRQCEGIGGTGHARVTLVATPPPRDQTAPRARSRITRHVFGALRATIEIPVTGDYAELIGHEFEHVIEQIEGIDLPALTRAGDGAVIELRGGVYETLRAAAAGRLIAEETLAAPDPIGPATRRRLSLAVRSLRSRLTATQPTLPWRR